MNKYKKFLIAQKEHCLKLIKEKECEIDGYKKILMITEKRLLETEANDEKIY